MPSRRGLARSDLWPEDPSCVKDSFGREGEKARRRRPARLRGGAVRGKVGASVPAEVGAIRRRAAWRRGAVTEEGMPSLIRFLIGLVVLAVIAVGAMFALANLVEPKPREMTIRVPQERLDPR